MTSLSEIISKLVQDSADGVLAAEIEIEEKRLEIAEMLKKAPEELVDDEEVDEFLKKRFPDPRDPEKTAIRAGMPYFSPDLSKFKHLEEFPPIEKVMGIRLKEEDVELKEGRLLLTEKAVEKVRRAARQKLGAKRRELLVRISEQGLPKPVVETMNLEVKMSFDENLKVRIPSLYEADLKVVPEAIGKAIAHLRFEKG